MPLHKHTSATPINNELRLLNINYLVGTCALEKIPLQPLDITTPPRPPRPHTSTFIGLIQTSTNAMLRNTISSINDMILSVTFLRNTVLVYDVPFANGSFTATDTNSTSDMTLQLVILSGAAELIASAISMSIDGFLASQVQYRFLHAATSACINHSCDGEMEREVADILAPIGIDETTGRDSCYIVPARCPA
ncbi:hypothetical protein B0H10DRAFT_2428030 [Mycena sp. CBHHK59/15]|nr:hypothetical protein B0H10DRAFT_2428030 [Mycena sp. CBHHK59/15]